MSGGLGPTLAELDRRVRGRLSEEGSEFFSPQNVLDFLNEGQDVVAVDCPWTSPVVWTLSDTIRNTSRFLLDPDCIKAESAEVRLDNGISYPLDEKDSDWMRAAKGFTSRTAGTPRYCAFERTREGILIEIHPAPSTARALSVRGYARPTPFVNLTDRSDVPPQIATTLVAYGLMRCKEKDEEGAEYDRAAAEFLKHMKDLKADRFVAQARSHAVKYGRSFYGEREWIG